MTRTQERRRRRLERLATRCDRVADDMSRLAEAIKSAGINADADHFNPDQLKDCIELELSRLK